MTLVVSARGIVVRQAGTRAYHAWSAFGDGQLTRGLLWLDAEPGYLIAVPPIAC